MICKTESTISANNDIEASQQARFADFSESLTEKKTLIVSLANRAHTILLC